MKYIEDELDAFNRELNARLIEKFGDRWAPWVQFDWDMTEVCLDGHFHPDELRFIADFMEEKQNV